MINWNMEETKVMRDLPWPEGPEEPVGMRVDIMKSQEHWEWVWKLYQMLHCKLNKIAIFKLITENFFEEIKCNK